MAIQTTPDGDGRITTEEYGDVIRIETSVIASRVHLYVGNRARSALATLNRAEQRELRDHLTMLIGD